MDDQIQRGPSDLSGDFLGLTNHTEVLHDYDVNDDSGVFLESQSPEEDEQSVLPQVRNKPLLISW